MRYMHHAIPITQNLGIDLSIKHFDVPERQRQTGELHRNGMPQPTLPLVYPTA